MRARIALVVAAFGTALIALQTAAAQVSEAPAPGLDWVRLAGAEACIGAAQLAQRVESRVGRSLFGPAASAGLFVDGYVSTPAPGRWHVELAVVDTEGRVLGRRSFDFEGEACGVIDEAVTLVIAVTLYPNSGLSEAGIPLDPGTARSLDALFGAEPTDPDPSTLPNAAPPATTSGAAPPPEHVPVSEHEAPEQADVSAWHVGVDLVGTTGLGQLPGVAFGAGARIVLALGAVWPFEIGVTGFAPATQDAGASSAGSARFDVFYASVAACPGHPSWFSALALCAGAELGRIRIQPRGFEGESAATGSDLIANLAGSAVLRVPLTGPLQLRVAITGLVPLFQRSYTYQAPDATSVRLFRMSQIAGRAEIGMGLNF